ncbi:MAG: hypothetical protein CVU11_02480 [Bacteroidetes bacterium HGW-Bacteroidetes-6]|jgi:hypothetical protein|nr:MAG: hypothetical protein CVU11_02480 [Bacteroidetes bacterium HGW-Bacteroidetes-6]
MKTAFKILFVPLLLLIVVPMSAQGWEWTRVSGGASSDESYQVCTDASGNVFQTGTYYGTADFQGTQLASVSGGYNWFLAKYNSDGNLLWVRNVLSGNTGYKQVKAITTDSNGNVFMAGEFEDSVLVGGSQANSGGYYDVYLAKFDASGNTQWVETGGGIFDERAFSLTTDQSGNVYLAGCFTENAVFDTVSLSGASVNMSDDAMLLCYNSAGKIQYGKSFGGISYERATGIAQYNNKLYMVGYFYSTDAYFDTYVLHNTNSGDDLFLVELNLSGAINWVKGFDLRMSTASNTRWPFVAANAEGIYVSCPFEQTIDLGNGPITPDGSSCISFMSQFDFSGNVQWVNKLDNRISASTKGLTAIPGHVYSTINFVDTLKIGAQQFIGTFPTPAYAENNISIVSWNSNGTIDWAKTVEPYSNGIFVGSVRSTSIATSGNDVFLSATFSDTINMWPWYPVAEDILTTDVLLAKIDITANAIEQAQTPLFSVYPVPAVDVLTIASAENGPINCTVTDVYGKIVQQIGFADGVLNHININGLASGVYFVSIESLGTTSVSRFVKQ